jgi:hypothetical protein
LDVVKDGVDKMTENTPFLRQSIAEVQDNFVHFLHEARIIQKVKGLGDKTLFPDWATWSQDVFDQVTIQTYRLCYLKESFFKIMH